MSPCGPLAVYLGAASLGHTETLYSILRNCQSFPERLHRFTSQQEHLRALSSLLHVLESSYLEYVVAGPVAVMCFPDGQRKPLSVHLWPIRVPPLEQCLFQALPTFLIVLSLF